MGTETNIIAQCYSYFIRYSVKLNNPPMGTETNMLQLGFRLSCNYEVKLNNPPMGTETFLNSNEYYVDKKEKS